MSPVCVTGALCMLTPKLWQNSDALHAACKLHFGLFAYVMACVSSLCDRCPVYADAEALSKIVEHFM